MRWLAWLVLTCGPLLAAPAAVGLWTRARLSGVHDGDIYALAAAAAGLLAVGLLISVRGLVREVTMLVLSTFWSLWLWLGMTDDGYHWARLPQLRIPDPACRMMILLTILVYLTLYVVAESRPSRLRA